MANALYDKGREGFLAGEIDWDTDVIKAILIDTADYAVNLATHQFLSDIPGAARVAISGAFSGKTAANGVADADDLTFPTVSGDLCEALVIYQDTGTEGTSRLIAYIDAAIGLPVLPNGGNISLAWDNGANKIFKL
jgi:hypothetical protein